MKRIQKEFKKKWKREHAYFQGNPKEESNYPLHNSIGETRRENGKGRKNVQAKTEGELERMSFDNKLI